jgi:uncharacterized protein
MILDLRSIFAKQEERLTYDAFIDLTEMDIYGYCPFEKPIHFSCEITNISVVELKGKANFDYYSQCDRCAIDIIEPITIDINHILVTEFNNDENEDYIVIPDMLLDITELATSDILLQLPSKFLCKDDCKGICPTCGNNLNELQCICDKPIDPRLEALKELLN